jgi:ferredoxin
MKELVIYGRASQKEIKTIVLTANDFQLNLMELLLDNGIPVASSCNGDGVCLKCILTVNGEKVLSCQCNVSDIFKDHDSVTVLFSYL